MYHNKLSRPAWDYSLRKSAAEQSLLTQCLSSGTAYANRMLRYISSEIRCAVHPDQSFSTIRYSQERCVIMLPSRGCIFLILVFFFLFILRGSLSLTSNTSISLTKPPSCPPPPNNHHWRLLHFLYGCRLSHCYCSRNRINHGTYGGTYRC